MTKMSTNAKCSEAMSGEIITALSRAYGASIFLFELFKNNLESICCPCYEMNAGSWQAWVLITSCISAWILSKIINLYKWEALISFVGGREEKTCRRKKKEKKKNCAHACLCVELSSSMFSIQFTNALS